MREIIFRGKTEKGEWVYGDLIHPDLYGNGYSIEDFTKGKNNCFDVIPETVGQYTGLTDKNGKKIFEGDIVQYITFDDFDCQSIVKFGEYKQDGSDGEYNRSDCIGFYAVAKECEVIGNIHDNPELLGGGAG